MNYTDDDNPFGDSQLSKTFVWHKKGSSRSSKRGRNVDNGNDSSLLEDPDEKRMRIGAEAAAARAARERRDAERELVREEREKEARRKEADENADWELKEEQFLADQYYATVLRRVTSGRLNLMDNLGRAWISPQPAHYVTAVNILDRETDAVLLSEVLDGCEKELDCAELVPGRGPPFVPDENSMLRARWWAAVRDMAHAIAEDRKNVSHPMADQVASLIDGKNADELRQIADEIHKEDSPDMEFWSAVLAKIRRRLLGLQISEMEQILREKMTVLEQQMKETDAKEAAVPTNSGPDSEDQKQGHISEADWLAAENSKKMGEDEDAHNDEVDIEEAMQKYLWHDKYRPRKPKYFNRVHTAYDWNKYNQTHYDHDNPPPKTVQAYKFNLFYPDLIDKKKTPTYKVIKTPNPDVSILRFSAGPPYQDVAFKVVNREWEHSHKRGYRCSFERGVLHLWFNFKRYRYRR